MAFAEWFYSRQQLKLCTRTSMNVTTRIISQYLTISYMHSLSCLQQCFVMFTTQHCRLGTVKLRGDFCTACHCGPANHPNEHKECSTTAGSINFHGLAFMVTCLQILLGIAGNDCVSLDSHVRMFLPLWYWCWQSKPLFL